MQNTSQTFRGTATPGVNYSDHTYDNHIGNHCQSTGYQPYSNQLYHPRPHHYGNHQMQQNMPYRHHGGGGYTPNQNQYGQTINQDLYRSNHPGYAGGNNRNIPSKSWTENNNSSDLMPPYGQVSSHSQMMSNPTQLPVTAMRSPPHAASNMNQSASQGQQHFRPMQSPAHSPHSWSQAQIPSPGMMHSSRTSPLPAHVRSPGHSQPFSPPAAHSMNLQSHQSPQENGQLSQSINSSSDNPTNPLHSLQKMVLLEQDSKAMMALPGDANEQFQNQCGSHSFVPEDGTTNDPKDSQYSTYYNMDENRFESKPTNDTNDPSVYSSLQSMTNCNYPIPPHPVTNEADIKNVARVPGNVNPNIPEAFHSSPNQNSLPPQMSSALEQSQCKSGIPQNDCSLKQNECPPHAESAPVFTDQTKAAVSTNSEQALESKSSSNWVADTSDPEKASVAQISYADTAGTPHSSVSQERCAAFQPPSNDSSKENSLKESEISTVNSEQSSCKDHEKYTLNATEFKAEIDSEKSNQEMQIPSSTLSSESQDCDSNITSSDSKSCSSYEDSQCSEKKITNNHEAGVNYEDIPSLEMDNRSNSQPESHNPKTSTNDSRSPLNPSPSSSDQNETESHSPPRNPVKVVIHRIRKSDADDTWHVPGNTTKTDDNKNKIVPESKQNVGPQIIMLSQAVSEKKSDSRNSSTPNSVTNTDDGNNEEKEDTNSSVIVKEEPTDESEKNSNIEKNSSIDKKRGRPAGSKNRMKPPATGKSKRSKKGTKKKKGENTKQKPTEVASKVKKVKVFNGPYIHITGSKESPSTISIVNVAQKEEEKLSKTQTKRNVSSAVSRIKSKTVGHLSTLSPTYDAYNRDKTWVCIFCQKGSHHGGLGDLYGPYYIKGNPDEKNSPSTSGTGASRNKRKKSETEDSRTPKRAKQSTNQTTPNSKSQQSEDADDTEHMKEVWLHEDCAVWCQNVTMIGEEVRGLEEAVMEANENKCHKCAFHGATLGCWGKGCKEMYHYTCAKETGCQLDIEKFSLLCPRHQKKSSENQKRCQ